MFLSYTDIFGLALPSRDCKVPTRVVSWLGTTAGWMSTLLFLFRVNSVFYNCRCARVFFTLLWGLAALGVLVVPFSFSSTPVPPKSLCAISTIKKFGFVPSISVALFDFGVYVSISYRTINPRAVHTPWAIFKAFFTGTKTGPITKALLHTGQLYFLYSLLLSS